MATIPVRIEPPGENPLLEVTYDGQEITQPPLTMSENLSKLAHKIDFTDDDMMTGAGTPPEDMEVDGESKGADKDDDEDMKSFSQPVWPWESVRNKLRDALTELCVASDVLSIATKDCGKDPGSGNPRRYMVLDGPVQVEQHEPKPFVLLLAMKKALEAPSKILIQGAEHLKNLQNETKGARAPEDFHIELLRLRQNWRLKKVGNSILGDLSYRTAGSQFKQSGVFEVTKADDADNQGPSSATSSGVAPGSSTPGGGSTTPQQKFTSALKVRVPSELEGVAYIQVMIQRDNEQLISATIGQFSGLAQTSETMDWKGKLEAAQNALFCKELFSQLAREAVQLQAPIPHMVAGSHIIASLFPDIQLTISLCHSSAGDGRKKSSGAAPPSRNDHSDVLEHSLFQLLRKVQAANINPDGPSLSSAPIGIPKKRREAGPEAADKHSLLEMASSETLLEQIVRQAQHVVLRLRTIYVLDTLAREFKDPLITSHWSTLSSPTCSSVRVSILSAGYDIIMKTQLVIHVGEKMQRVICRDGRVLNFSYEPQELRDFILCQLSQHQISGVQNLAKVMGWQVLSASSFLGNGAVEPLGSAAGCLLSNAKADKFLAVRHCPQWHCQQFNYTVYMAQAPSGSTLDSVIEDKKWDNLPSIFKEVKVDKMDGKNLLNKKMSSNLVRILGRAALTSRGKLVAPSIHNGLSRSQCLAAYSTSVMPKERVTATLIPGDGVGPELVDSVEEVFKAAGVPMDFEVFFLSEVHSALSSPIDTVVESIARNGMCLKGILQTPAYSNERETLNIKLRNELDLYANVVKVKSMEGVRCKHNNVDLVVIREQTEGEYSCLEHESVPGVVECLKIVTAEKSYRIAKFAFDYATKFNRSKVTVIHKANIMKLGDGLFLKCCTEISKLYPNIEFESMIVDNACMQLVAKPQQFDVLVMPNLYGNIIANLATGLVGGAGLVAGEGYSQDCVVFEPGARHSFTEAGGKNVANPTAMLLSSANLLDHASLHHHAKNIRESVYKVLKAGKVKTKDLGGYATTKQFTQAVINNLKK